MAMTRRTLLAAAAAAAAAPAHAEAPVRLVARPRRVRGLAGEGETEIWSFGEGTPGPVLRPARGEPFVIEVENGLQKPLALHWQGLRIAADQDDLVPFAPGALRRYAFAPPDSGSFLYTAWGAEGAEQAGRGLYGWLIVPEASPPPVDAEILAAIDDWRIDPDGALAGGFGAAADVEGAGRIGPRLTVEGRPAPREATLAPRARVRLRLLNASTARIMLVGFVGVRPLVAAIDGQPCDLFEPVRQTIPMGPGARFDILFDMPEAPGAEAAVVLRPPAEAPPGTSDRPLLSWTAAGAALPARPDATSLPPNRALPAVIRLQDARRLDLAIEGGLPVAPGAGAAWAGGFPPAGLRLPPAGATPKPWRLGGVVGRPLPARPLFSVPRGTPVTLGFLNKTRFPQAMHVQGHVMRQLHLLDDGWEPYWRDTVLVGELRTVRVAFLADNPGRWRIESRIPERAAWGLSTWFEVT